jgi:hypothetical protein
MLRKPSHNSEASLIMEVIASIPRDTMTMAFRRAVHTIEAVEDDGGTFTTTTNKIHTLMNISRKFR